MRAAEEEVEALKRTLAAREVEVQHLRTEVAALQEDVTASKQQQQVWWWWWEGGNGGGVCECVGWDRS